MGWLVMADEMGWDGMGWLEGRAHELWVREDVLYCTVNILGAHRINYV